MMDPFCPENPAKAEDMLVALMTAPVTHCRSQNMIREEVEDYFGDRLVASYVFTLDDDLEPLSEGRDDLDAKMTPLMDAALKRALEVR